MEVESTESQTIQASAGAGNSTPATDVKKRKFIIRKYVAYADWSWAIQQDTCSICRNSLNEPSVMHMASNSTSENGKSLCIGLCNHGYHLDCIQQWHKTRPNCPMCNREWAWENCKIEKIGQFN